MIVVLAMLASLQAPPADTVPDLAGWYVDGGGARILVSPAPHEGWRHLDFDTADFGALAVGGPGGARVEVGSAPGRVALSFPDGRRWTADPDPPYALREISIPSDDVALAGLLLLPAHPAGLGAVILQGSGDSDRDNVWAYTFAHTLAAAGVAVLFPDKRGSGASGGDWRTVGFDALARDAVAEARVLAHETGLPPNRIGWVGLSQGGWIAPLAARIAGGGAFVVSMSSAAVPVFDQIRHEIRRTLEADGVAEAGVGDALRLQRVLERHALGESSWQEFLVAREAASAGPAADFAQAMPAEETDWRWAWWARTGTFDPLDSWLRAGLPTLVVYGAEDEQDNVPVARSVERLRTLQARPGSPVVSVTVVPGVGHALVDPDRGWVSRSVLAELVAWVLQPAPGAGLSPGR